MPGTVLGALGAGDAAMGAGGGHILVFRDLTLVSSPNMQRCYIKSSILKDVQCYSGKASKGPGNAVEGCGLQVKLRRGWQRPGEMAVVEH